LLFFLFFGKTNSTDMARFFTRNKAIIAFIVVIVAGYALVLFWQSKNQVPVAFVNARAQGAIIAESIVTTSNQSTATLEQVSQDDQDGDYKDALTLVTGMVSQSATLRNQAIDLSNQIQQMTESLSGVHSLAAQQAALEAISSHLAVINQLINYSGDLSNLLTALQAKFSGQPSNGQQIQSLVNQINTDVNAINNFNNQATQAMQQFDTIEGK
jgi:hypothetical protein